jgi:hypothetical protein
MGTFFTFVLVCGRWHEATGPANHPQPSVHVATLAADRRPRTWLAWLTFVDVLYIEGVKNLKYNTYQQ